MSGDGVGGVWLLATSASDLAELARAAAGGGPLTGVLVGAPVDDAGLDATAVGLERLDRVAVSAGQPVESAAAAVAGLVAAASPLVVASSREAGARVLLGACAARLGAPVLAGVTALAVVGAEARVTRGLWGGIVEQDEATAGPVALVLAGEPSGAEFVVGVGVGAADPAGLAAARGLADALGADLACTRPVAEGLGVLPRDRVVGASGRTVRPALYVAAGVSGQLHHVVGVRDAGTIVAVNTDPGAAIFALCDYGSVGEAAAVLRAITRALGAP